MQYKLARCFWSTLSLALVHAELATPCEDSQDAAAPRRPAAAEHPHPTPVPPAPQCRHGPRPVDLDLRARTYPGPVSRRSVPAVVVCGVRWRRARCCGRQRAAQEEAPSASAELYRMQTEEDPVRQVRIALVLIQLAELGVVV
ncbi:hypothetical protein B0H19DRAFT_155587 [Mycena capillaripes]|nr:hypothetical protein B0H19DRAFT_155587 [Mycena capillaripes]